MVSTELVPASRVKRLGAEGEHQRRPVCVSMLGKIEITGNTAGPGRVRIAIKDLNATAVFAKGTPVDVVAAAPPHLPSDILLSISLALRNMKSDCWWHGSPNDSATNSPNEGRIHAALSIRPVVIYCAGRAIFAVGHGPSAGRICRRVIRSYARAQFFTGLFAPIRSAMVSGSLESIVPSNRRLKPGATLKGAMAPVSSARSASEGVRQLTSLALSGSGAVRSVPTP